MKLARDRMIQWENDSIIQNLTSLSDSTESKLEARMWDERGSEVWVSCTHSVILGNHLSYCQGGTIPEYRNVGGLMSKRTTKKSI